MTQPSYLPEVRAQYEELPYPPRNPEDEKTRLATTWLDDLGMINHYCFAGRQSFRERFRVLVAGGGTGDATIFLAEQLRDTDADIVHVDLSSASIALCQQRAQVRGLDNITWINDSLLRIPELGLGQFDYINCVGVLHHLANPDAGLRALLAVLKQTGALGLMVYGTYGRTGIYQMQSLLRLINQHAPETSQRLANAKSVLGALPPSNWFKRGEPLYHDHKLFGDAGIYDMLLHSTDRSYTVGELYEWIHDRHCLQIAFTDVGRGRAVYSPAMLVGPQRPAFLESVAALPLRQQHEIAELLGGSLDMHCFYAARSPDTGAVYGDPEQVPYFFHEPLTGPDLARLIEQNKAPTLLLNHSHTGIAMHIDPGQFSQYIAKHIDGQRSFAEIFALVRAEPRFQKAPPGDAQLFEDFRPLYDFLRAIDRMLLRHRTLTPVYPR
jgi:ubiquinone/menaquinone biosynthesis C-methylase UbiE